MSGIDASLWYIDRPTHPMTGCVAFLLDTSTAAEGYSFDRLRDHFQILSGHVHAAHRRVVEVPFGLAHPGWVVAGGGVDLDDVVERVTLLDDDGPAAFNRVVASAISRMMDHDQPFWRWIVVENVAPDRVGVVLLGNHAVTDGVSGAQDMALTFVPAEALAAVPPVVPAPAGMPSRSDTLRWALGQRTARWRQTPEDLAAVAGILRSKAKRFRHGDGVGMFRGVPGVYWNREVGPHRSMTTTKVELGAVKALARSLDVSVNDVLLAAVGGALREHLLLREMLPARSLVAGCPVATNNPRESRSGREGNFWSAMRIPIGTDDADFARRCRAIGARTSATKAVRAEDGSAWPAIAEHVPGWLYRIGMTIAERIHLTDWMPPVVNVVVSNIPGSPMAMELAGFELAEMYMAAPLVFGRALTLVAVSYQDQLHLSLIADADRIPHAATIVAHLDRELAMAFAAAGIGTATPAATTTTPATATATTTDAALVSTSGGRA